MCPVLEANPDKCYANDFLFSFEFPPKTLLTKRDPTTSRMYCKGMVACFALAVIQRRGSKSVNDEMGGLRRESIKFSRKMNFFHNT